MIISDAFEKQKAKENTRRARVVVLGEFSAGKSTLINLLSAGKTLHTQVTATQRPAVWMSWGTSAPYRVDLKGKEHPVDLSDHETMPLADTAYIRTFMKTPVLELCDFIDTPGNSDPNIPASAWERVAKIADVAVWLSPATQAWRQSELAAWSDVPASVREKSILLLTRADKLTSDTDREKVLRRVTREAGDQFSKIHMASLLNFADAREFLRDLIALCRTVDLDSSKDATILETFQAAMPPVTESATAIDLPEDAPVDAWEEDIAASSEDDDFNDFAIEALLDASPVIEPVATAEPEPETEPAKAAIPRPGRATEIWAEITDAIPADDGPALNNAFGTFLARLDEEFALLETPMKAAV